MQVQFWLKENQHKTVRLNYVKRKSFKNKGTKQSIIYFSSPLIYNWLL